jgi:hypothetical protein
LWIIGSCNFSFKKIEKEVERERERERESEKERLLEIT